MKTVYASKVRGTRGRKDAFDQLDEVVIGMMRVAYPDKVETFTCDDVSAFLRRRTTQRELLRRCRGDVKKIDTLMRYLAKRGVHMRDVIVDVKRVNKRLAFQLCRASVRQLVMS